MWAWFFIPLFRYSAIPYSAFYRLPTLHVILAFSYISTLHVIFSTLHVTSALCIICSAVHAKCWCHMQSAKYHKCWYHMKSADITWSADITCKVLISHTKCWYTKCWYYQHFVCDISTLYVISALCMWYRNVSTFHVIYIHMYIISTLYTIIITYKPFSEACRPPLRQRALPLPLPLHCEGRAAPPQQAASSSSSSSSQLHYYTYMYVEQCS